MLSIKSKTGEASGVYPAQTFCLRAEQIIAAVAMQDGNAAMAFAELIPHLL